MDSIYRASMREAMDSSCSERTTSTGRTTVVVVRAPTPVLFDKVEGVQSTSVTS